MLWLWDETWYDRHPSSHTTLRRRMLNLYDSRRPELLHPFASAIDEPELKVPEEMVRVIWHIKLDLWY